MENEILELTKIIKEWTFLMLGFTTIIAILTIKQMMERKQEYTLLVKWMEFNVLCLFILLAGYFIFLTFNYTSIGNVVIVLFIIIVTNILWYLNEKKVKR